MQESKNLGMVIQIMFSGWIFMTVPDYYYFVGSNKYPFKYNEDQYLLNIEQ